MKYPELHNRSIFAISIAEFFGERFSDVYLIYVPLANYLSIENKQFVEKINSRISHLQDISDLAYLLQELLGIETKITKPYTIQNVREYQYLYILPNFTCNFACSYCFSAKGRSNKILSEKHMKVMIDYFIDPKRLTEKKLCIIFLGGGEPMLSWNLVQKGIEYASNLAQKHDIYLMMEIVTNGSIINNEILDTLIKYDVQPRVSFEVLKHIQNLQRGQYDRVCKTMQHLSNANIKPQVRAMITPANVNHMMEMVETLVDKFPNVDHYLFDAITDEDTFDNVEKTRLFYEAYSENFGKSMMYATKHNKTLMCAPLRNLDSIVERYCFGELCLTPEGTVTICHRIASPVDEDYNRCVYGQIDESNRLIINEDKFQRLINSDTIYDNPNCQTCFMKWNCGGGCMAQNKQYRPEIKQEICNFTRKFSVEMLLRKLDKEQLEKYGLI